MGRKSGRPLSTGRSRSLGQALGHTEQLDASAAHPSLGRAPQCRSRPRLSGAHRSSQGNVILVRCVAPDRWWRSHACRPTVPESYSQSFEVWRNTAKAAGWRQGPVRRTRTQVGVVESAPGSAGGLAPLCRSGRVVRTCVPARPGESAVTRDEETCAGLQFGDGAGGSYGTKCGCAMQSYG